MKKVLLGGLLGGVILIGWLIVVDGIFGFKRSIDMNQLPNERGVYTFLVEHVTEPGRYVVNPEVVPDQGSPGDDPIFAVHYTGLGHADAGQEMLSGLVVVLLAPIVGAWLLANASRRILSRYALRVSFFAIVGILVGLLGVGARFGLASYSLGNAVALAGHDVVAWVLAGFVVAALVKQPMGET